MTRPVTPLPHPHLHRLGQTLGEALTLLTVHCERHALQAWRVREHPEFPEEIA